jgi:recombination protein RecR
MRFPVSIQKLIDEFAKLPTVGPKTAERYVFYLLKQNPEKLQALAQAIAELKEKTTTCQNCFALAEASPCNICTDTKRQLDKICVVADTRDYLTIEATGSYLGRYFILDGELNQIEGISPEQLNIKQLIEKLKDKNIKEVILALDPTIEGETTVLYLTKLLKPLNLKITRLAKGLPMGANLEYADELTLTNALKYRSEL